jgi:hypothetical protein
LNWGGLVATVLLEAVAKVGRAWLISIVALPTAFIYIASLAYDFTSRYHEANHRKQK